MVNVYLLVYFSYNFIQNNHINVKLAQYNHIIDISILDIYNGVHFKD